jgi:hypothetical protein
MGKSKKTKSTPASLAKTGKKAGVELSEKELGQAAGGCADGKHLTNLVPAV